jgi:tubulin polyglutamylase TTLL6/13
MEHFVVQKYLNNPLLIENLKFDLRLYVLLGGVDPLRIYLYNDGLARFCTSEYESVTKSNMKNLTMHLTNYAINKFSKKFVFNTSEDAMDVGHKRNIKFVLNYLKERGHNTDLLWKKIKKLIIKTICSGQPRLMQHYRSS